VAKVGDRSAFAELWKRHSRTAFNKVYEITKNRADAEDVIQEAWRKAFTHLNETWQIRDIVDQAKDVEEQYVTSERVKRLKRAICRLSPQLRAVVEIQQSKDVQVKEVAELAGISISATKSRLLRARTILRRALV
jgi:RNA polymerase sigma-70 factor (ECF subfamily)